MAIVMPIPAIECDPNTWAHVDGDAALPSKAPSYTIALFISGDVVVVSVFCP